MILTYWRYMAPMTEDVDSVDEAVSFLAWGEEFGELTSRGAKVEDEGRIVIEGDALHDLVMAAWAKMA